MNQVGLTIQAKRMLFFHGLACSGNAIAAAMWAGPARTPALANG